MRAPTATGMNTNPAEACRHRGHEFSNHTLLFLLEEPVPAGCIICPELGCHCWSTWSLGR
jgi:hypothetical protein